jgi:hypothetical protein
MIPQGAAVAPVTLDETPETSVTYRLDLENGRMSGRVDGLEAVKQAVYKILHTERYDYFCYSADYGVELEGVLGGDSAYFRIELERRLAEALLQDERVLEVTDFRYESDAEKQTVAFTVVTEFGSFGEEVVSGV